MRSLKSSTLKNITTLTDLKTAAADADLVIEAATENREIKLNLFKQLSDYCKEGCDTGIKYIINIYYPNCIGN